MAKCSDELLIEVELFRDEDDGHQALQQGSLGTRKAVLEIGDPISHLKHKV